MITALNKFSQEHRSVYLSLLGFGWLWFLLGLAQGYLSQSPDWLFVIVANGWALGVGVALGVVCAYWASGEKVELGIIPIGAFMLTLTLIHLSYAQPSSINSLSELWKAPHLRLLIDLALTGFFAALFGVPLPVLVLERSLPEHRRPILLVAVLGSIAMLALGGILGGRFIDVGFTWKGLCWVLAALNSAVALFLILLIPEFFMRCVAWVVISLCYRIKIEGLHNIPSTGAVILTCNHVSFVDAIIVGGLIRRPVRFVTYHKIYKIPGLNALFKAARAIPIAPAKEDEALLKAAYITMDEVLKSGEILGIFPEGGLTIDGRIQEFKPGIERMLARTPVPVVPMALRGLWTSMWSRRDSRLGRMRIPRRLRAQVTLVIGQPLPPDTVTAAKLQTIIEALRGDCP